MPGIRQIGFTLSLLLGLVAPASAADLGAAPFETLSDGSMGGHVHRPYTSPVCDGGRAISTLGERGARVLLGRCGASGTVASSAEGPTPAPGPADCVIPGHDDLCESWVAPRYDGPWAGDDYPGFGSIDRTTTVLASPDGELVFVGGTSVHGSGTSADADFVEIAYSAETGRPVWTQQYAGEGADTLAYQSAIALSSDASILYAVGVVAEPGVYAYSGVVVAFEAATGRRLWSVSTPWFWPSAMAVAPAPEDSSEDRVYLAGIGGGTTEDGESALAGVILSLDASDGDELWRKDYVASSFGSVFNDLVVTPDGSTVIAGGGDNREDGLRMNYATVAYDSEDGRRLWLARDDITAPDGFYGINGVSDMAVSPDGSRVFVTGFDPVAGNDPVDQNDNYSAILTVAHDVETGVAAWRGSYLGPVAGERHFYFGLFAGNIGITPDGSTVVVTGSAERAGAGTVAYNASNGTQLWGVEYRDPTTPLTNLAGMYPVLAVTADRVVVADPRGYGWDSMSFVTMGLRLTDGTPAWTARFSSGENYPVGVALSPDRSHVYVTGISEAVSGDMPGSTRDIETVAYEI